jgi:large subunit ribosomal protein L25
MGTRANRRLRNTGLIPVVVYGHHQDVLPLQVNRKEMVRHIEHGTHVFNLDLAGKSESVLIKDVQFDALGKDLLHVDFARVDLNERVTVTVGIELKGDPKGEKEGGVLQQILNEIEIECVVTEIPSVIEVDVSDMAKDSSLYVSDLKLPAGATVLTDAEQIVCKVEEIEEQSEEPEVEGAAEPEVIGAKADDAAADADAK